jgi:hypothetical protein
MPEADGKTGRVVAKVGRVDQDFDSLNGFTGWGKGVWFSVV